MTQHDPTAPRPGAAMPDTPAEDPPSMLGPNAADELMGAAAGRIQELEAELEGLRDRWLRAEAEQQNISRRMRSEIENTRQFGVQKFARDMVDAAENFSRALAALPPPAEGEPELVTRMRDGLAASERALLAMLEKNGVVREPAAGTPFDPERHQAMAEAASATVPAGHVMEAYSPAWTLNGRLLKPAMVVVSRGAAAPDRPATGTEG